MSKQLLAIFAFVLSFIGCSKLDPSEPIPSYIKIDAVSIDATTAQGSNNAKGIIDAWIFVDEELIGVFELPLTIPVLKSGKRTIKIFPGIKRNGMRTNGVIYPFMNHYEITTTLVEGEILTLSPVFTYRDDATLWLEDFEGPSVKFIKSNNSDVDLEITTTAGEVYEGTKSAKGIFNPDDILFEIETDEAAFNNFNLGSTIYLEMDYSTTTLLSIGVYSRKTGELVPIQNPYLRLFPTSETSIEWNKIYIDLTEIIRPQVPTEDLDLFIGVMYNKAQSEILPRAYFDNIKIIYF